MIEFNNISKKTKQMNVVTCKYDVKVLFYFPQFEFLILCFS